MDARAGRGGRRSAGVDGEQLAELRDRRVERPARATSAAARAAPVAGALGDDVQAGAETASPERSPSYHQRNAERPSATTRWNGFQARASALRRRAAAAVGSGESRAARSRRASGARVGVPGERRVVVREAGEDAAARRHRSTCRPPRSRGAARRLPPARSRSAHPSDGAAEPFVAVRGDHHGPAAIGAERDGEGAHGVRVARRAARTRGRRSGRVASGPKDRARPPRPTVAAAAALLHLARRLHALEQQLALEASARGSVFPSFSNHSFCDSSSTCPPRPAPPPRPAARAHVLAEARPEELAVLVLAEPVHQEDLRRVRDARPASRASAASSRPCCSRRTAASPSGRGAPRPPCRSRRRSSRSPSSRRGTRRASS